MDIDVVRSVPGSIPARVSIFRMGQNRRRKLPTDRIEDNVPERNSELASRFDERDTELMKESSSNTSFCYSIFVIA